MNSKLLTIPYIVAALAMSSCLVGCADSRKDDLPRAAVAGMVYLDNHPLEQGQIRFVPMEGTSGPKSTIKIFKGMFVIEEDYGPIVGTHRVEIESTDNGGYAMDDEGALQRLKASKIRKIEVTTVPAVYNSNSKLKETISEDGPNEFIFQLTSTK